MVKNWIIEQKEELFFTHYMDGYYDFPVYCPHCNAEVHSENYEFWDFCPYCGKKVILK